MEYFSPRTKADKKELDRLYKSLEVSTPAEKAVVNYLWFQDKTKRILVWDYGTIKEQKGWVRITTRTNKHSFDFCTLAKSLEEGNFKDLFYKID